VVAGERAARRRHPERGGAGVTGDVDTAAADRLVYLPGIAGHPASSPVLDALGAAGWDVVVPTIPGLDGRSGFQAPPDYTSWLALVWDALDATGALPCAVVGASLGGMLATDLAVFRPEAVTALALLAPFGIFDDAHPGLDLYAVPTAERMGHLFAKGVPEPFADRFGELGPDDGPVARYISDVAAANLLWPLGDRGQSERLHRVRCPAIVLWGGLDELLPVGTSEAWAGRGLAVEVVPGAGHLMEWDEPDGVAGILAGFLAEHAVEAGVGD
jgi:pimeloyl-ACP methyl ester carboxylesterase